MGGSTSKEEMVYLAVQKGDLRGIRKLRSEGASLEWRDSKGRTPLILACSRHDTLEAAKALLQLGANVNAASKGLDGGTSLHFAARKQLALTVQLLLEYGANPLLANDAGLRALDYAWRNKNAAMARAMEDRVALFFGSFRELTLSAPSFLAALVPQWVSRRVYVVVLPSVSPSAAHSLVVYPSHSSGEPQCELLLRFCRVSVHKADSSDPVLVVEDMQRAQKWKLAAVADNRDPFIIQRLHSACHGYAQRPLPALANRTPPPPPSTATAAASPQSQQPAHTASLPPGMSAATPSPPLPLDEDAALERAMAESLQLAREQGIVPPSASPAAPATSDGVNGWGAPPPAAPSAYGGWDDGAAAQQPTPRPAAATVSAPLARPAAAAAAAAAPVPSSSSARLVSASSSSPPSLPVRLDSSYGGWGVPPLPPSVSDTPHPFSPAGVAAAAAAAAAAASAGSGATPHSGPFPSAAPTAGRTAPQPSGAGEVQGGSGSGSSSGGALLPQPSLTDALPSAPPLSPSRLPEAAAAAALAYPVIDTTPVQIDYQAVASAAPVTARETEGERSEVELHPSYNPQQVESALKQASGSGGGGGGGGGGQCVICWDARAEAVCVPCGHVAGCMECLGEVKAKNWGCPVCRAEIREVIKVFHV